MKERERIVVIGLIVLMLILWLGFLVHRSPRFPGSAWGGKSVIEPIQVIRSARPSPVSAAIPGTRSSTATGPSAVAMTVPRAKAENASSNSGIAGASLVQVSNRPLASR